MTHQELFLDSNGSNASLLHRFAALCETIHFEVVGKKVFNKKYWIISIIMSTINNLSAPPCDPFADKPVSVVLESDSQLWMFQQTYQLLKLLYACVVWAWCTNRSVSYILPQSCLNAFLFLGRWHAGRMLWLWGICDPFVISTFQAAVLSLLSKLKVSLALEKKGKLIGGMHLGISLSKIREVHFLTAECTQCHLMPKTV